MTTFEIMLTIFGFYTIVISLLVNVRGWENKLLLVVVPVLGGSMCLLPFIKWLTLEVV